MHQPLLCNKHIFVIGENGKVISKVVWSECLALQETRKNLEALRHLTGLPKKRTRAA